MKKVILFGAFAIIIGMCANAFADGYSYTETETFDTYETIKIDTVTYVDTVYPEPVRVVAKPMPCRAASSMDVARTMRDCHKPTKRELAPVRVKTYSEVIDHYQVYQPVVTYKPAGEYTTRRYIDAPNPHCGTCAR